MSLWIEALKAAGQGHSGQARNLLNEITLALRYPRKRRADEDCAYDGPLAKAVLNAIHSFSNSEDRQVALSNAEDLIDYILDQISRKVLRTIELVEYCLNYPDKDLDSVTNGFDGLRALKRSPEILKAYVLLRLKSMNYVGVVFATESVAVVQASREQIDDTKLLGFDERQLVKSLPINEKWIDFRRRERLTYDHESFDLIRHDIAAETSDFGSIADKFVSFSVGRDLEFIQLAEHISRKLNEILDEFHNKGAEAGFRPIAFHKVWWEYDRDQYLGLECRSPECKTDEKLAEHISNTYAEVSKMNRLTAQRRRTKLEDACRESIAEIYQTQGRTI